MRNNPIVVDQPEPGFFKLRLYPGGWYEVPCRIVHEQGAWLAELDGEPAWPPHADPVHAKGVLDIWHKRKTEITESEYRFLTGALKEWAKAYYPDHPLLDPRQRVSLGRLRPIPQFTAPMAPEPLGEEPLPENRPSAPKPLNKGEINAWLEFENEQLIRTIERDLKALEQDRDVVVNDQESLARVSANVNIARAHVRQANSVRLKQNNPFRDGANAVNVWFKQWLVALDDAIEPIQRAMNRYGERIEEEARQVARARAAEAQAEAERLAALAAKFPSAIDNAIERAKEAERARALATGKAADLTRTHDVYGGVVSAKEEWDWEVEDISKVPLRLLQVNEVEMNKLVREWVKNNVESARAGIVPVKGIRLVRAIDMRSR